jgi:hypothetical protein
LSRVLIECVINGKLPHQSFFVGEPDGSEAVSYGPQAEPFRSYLLFPFNIGGTNNQAQPIQPWFLQMIVLDNRLEAAAGTSVVQLDLGKPWCVEWNSILVRSGCEQFAFVYEQELGFAELSMDILSPSFRVGAGLLFRRVRVVDGAAQGLRQLHSVIIRPEVHIEEPRHIVQRMTV